MAATSDISMIGLGAMGSALARAQLKAGHKVTVWNRTPKNAEPLAADGALIAASCAEAAAASPVIMVCLFNYAAADTVLNNAAVGPHLDGRTVIQLSTGTPKEAREMGTWLAASGASYVDGAIKCYPDKIGAPDSLVFVGGAKEAFTSAERFLHPIGGDLRYLGENAAAAAALDLGLLAVSVALYAGVAHGARVCAAEGVGVDQLACMIGFGPLPRNRAEIIHQDAFALNSLHPGGSLEVWTDVVDRIQAQAADSGINPALPNVLAAIYHRALDAGLGGEDVAALYKVLGR